MEAFGNPKFQEIVGRYEALRLFRAFLPALSFAPESFRM
jgi:hypothetical protein